MPIRSIHRIAFLLSASCFALSACTTHPDSVAARYVSPVAYQGYDCGQLTEEHRRLSAEVDRVTGLQRENANGDAVMLTVGLVLFWPALIGMAATKDRKDELGRLKGDYEAVDMQIRLKQCAMPFPITPPALPVPAAVATTSPFPSPVSTPVMPPARDLVVATPPPQRRSLGLEVLEVDAALANSTSLAEPKGVYVMSVVANGAAASGGLRQNDVILDFGASRVASIGDMQRALSDVRAGSSVQVTLWRDQRRVQTRLQF